jgi:sugar-phosphatase
MMIFEGLLFDLDGTLIDSNSAVDRAWRAWAARHGIDIDRAFQTIHGRPAKDSVAILLAGQPAHVIEQEFQWLAHAESTDVEGVVALAGSIALLEKLDYMGVPWAIVTSGTYSVATARISAAGLPTPKVLVTPELVTKGKPDPEPYLLGAEKLGLSIQDCIVFEDAPAGIEAGIASSADVIGVLSHFDQTTLIGATGYIQSMDDLDIRAVDNGFELLIRR